MPPPSGPPGGTASGAGDPADRPADRPADEIIAVDHGVGSIDVPAVLDLLTEAAEVDGFAALSEQAYLRLRHRRAAAELVALRDGDPVGYLQLDPDATPTRTAELAVRPAHRRTGRGKALITRALLDVPDGHLAIWAHGDTAAAAALAADTGFTRSRLLHRMRRSLAGLPAVPDLPAGVRLRTFEPGRDDEAWVGLNHRAFAWHPEQSRVSVDDLHERMAEPWFDPAGFFLAERPADDGRLVGFHWTKRHPANVAGGTEAGEVYVIGVDPSEQGTGLGKILTLTGLTYLAERGLPEVILYADETNSAAIAMYQRLGFAIESTDVLYAR